MLSVQIDDGVFDDMNRTDRSQEEILDSGCHLIIMRNATYS